MRKNNPDRLAFDRASVRTYTQDGTLQVSISPISKAMVCPYYGREIPDSEKLGLEPNKIYYLLRDPEELKKAAPTFNNLPVLNKHIPITADALPKENIVGTTGSDASFDAPYLNNSLAIWEADAIAGIDSDEQKELSSSYHYRADMTPGEYEGVKYDGVMRDLKGNHVALVPEGRAGNDVVVNDELPEGMKMKKLTAKDVARRTALSLYLRPRLAQDAAIDTKSLSQLIVSHASGKALAAAVVSKYRGKLAQDADLQEEEIEKTTNAAADEAEEDDKKPAEDDDEILQTVLSALEGKVNGDVLEKIKNALSGQASDADPDGEDDPDEDPPAQDSDDPVTKPAMDAALKIAKKQGRDAAVKAFNAIRQAEVEVKPLVGDVVAMDSAEEIYKYALEQEGIDIAGVHPSAYRSLVKIQLSANQAKKPGGIAMDAKTVTGFASRFPNATKLVRS
ncbi:DUF2213 domain-containing protein [Klebsiella pneumoniae]|uniref:DUF2213 domain-containing protein n=1 Tax=Klebsiella pneumoniae TaxID=573 RepID=UPI0012558FE2|nr:DUF2213 domain-containing protein [Klebsiella pneumoniae]VAP72382.1 Uncharacterized protein conserved in bacteria [Klebsiella pneumoniae]HBW3346591.1 DUF2213 domain-containing protein [Klebsiella pneumoniae]